MEKRDQIQWARQNVFWAGLCAVAVAVLLAVAVFPRHRAVKELEAQVREAEADLERQKILAPAYRNLQERMGHMKLGSFPLPQEEKLPRGGLQGIPAMFQDMMVKSDLEPVEVMPEIGSLSEKPGLLSLTMVARGSLPGFRRLLVRLGELPFVSGVEHIRIRSVERSKELMVRVSLVLDS